MSQFSSNASARNPGPHPSSKTDNAAFLDPRGFGGKYLEQSLPLRPISANAFGPVLDVGRIEEIVVARHFFHAHGRHLISRPPRTQRICRVGSQRFAIRRLTERVPRFRLAWMAGRSVRARSVSYGFGETAASGLGSLLRYFVLRDSAFVFRKHEYVQPAYCVMRICVDKV